MKKQHIGAIQNGINLDHIPCGNALKIMQILDLTKSNYQVGVGLNLTSKKLGRKDLIKIEDYQLTEDQINAISLFCVGATLSIIANSEVIEKREITLPPTIQGVIVCSNPRCISHQVTSKFVTCHDHKHNIQVKCFYCEHHYS
jgi:aspartate carbamoyltransferase regulatory subunit